MDQLSRHRLFDQPEEKIVWTWDGERFIQVEVEVRLDLAKPDIKGCQGEDKP